MCSNNRPHIWKLILVLKNEEARASTKIAAYAVGNGENPKVTLEAQQCQARIRNLIGDYLGGRIPMPMYSHTMCPTTLGCKLWYSILLLFDCFLANTRFMGS